MVKTNMTRIHSHTIKNSVLKKFRIPVAFLFIALVVIPFVWIWQEAIHSSTYPTQQEDRIVAHMDSVSIDSQPVMASWKVSSSATTTTTPPPTTTTTRTVHDMDQNSIPKVVIVSADGRRPRFGSDTDEVSTEKAIVTPETATFYEWAALMNLAYAEKHGYQYVYFVYTDNQGIECSHPLFGERHVAWCKLLAIEKVLSDLLKQKQNSSSIDIILWLDSDAAWIRPEVSVHSFLSDVGLGCFGREYSKENPPVNGTPSQYLMGCQTPTCREMKENASFLFFANRPYCEAAVMSGTFFVRASQQARQILSQWWNLDLCAKAFPWEQRAANTALYPNLAGRGIEVLSTSHNYFPSASDVAVHFGHFKKGGDVARAQAMRDTFNRIAGLDEEKTFTRLSRAMQSHIIDLRPEELKIIGDGLSSITWDKNSSTPDVSWMTKYNYSSSAEKWATCDYVPFPKPRYLLQS